MRMVQTAFESNMAAQQLMPNAITILQISHSLLKNTETLVQQIQNSESTAHESIA